MNNLEFVTGTTRIYRLAGNDWFAVSQDDKTVLLVDTDCALPRTDGTLVGLESRWSDGDWNTSDGESGQNLLNYTNSLADKYFSEIKYAIKPADISVDCVQCFNAPTNLKGNVCKAYMFSLSCDEVSSCPAIGGKIFENSRRNRDKLKNQSDSNLSGYVVWTRTFSGISSYNDRCAWCLYSTDGDINNYGVGNLCRVAPAFYLRKDAIDYIADDGEIILEPYNTVKKLDVDKQHIKEPDFFTSGDAEGTFLIEPTDTLIEAVNRIRAKRGYTDLVDDTNDNDVYYTFYLYFNADANVINLQAECANGKEDDFVWYDIPVSEKGKEILMFKIIKFFVNEELGEE